MSDLIEVRCRGCYRLMGVGNGPPMHKLFCTELCAADYPVSDNEERDDMIETLVRLKKWNPTKVSLSFDITRQRAQQIIKDRVGA